MISPAFTRAERRARRNFQPVQKPQRKTLASLSKKAGIELPEVHQKAAILQSFPPDFPFQGTKSQRFLQVGNAVPPAMAIPIFGELLGIDWRETHADYLATYSKPAHHEQKEAA